MEEAAQEIEYLETKIETEKADYEERILNVEAELAVMRTKEVRPPEVPRVMIDVGTDTNDFEMEADTETEEGSEEDDRTSLETTRTVYYESVQSYRRVISRLEVKVRTAEVV